MRERWGGLAPAVGRGLPAWKNVSRDGPLRWRFIYLCFLLLLEEFGGRGFVGYRRVFGVIEDRVELRGIWSIASIILICNWMDIDPCKSKVLNGCLEIVKLIYASWYMLNIIFIIYFDDLSKIKLLEKVIISRIEFKELRIIRYRYQALS